MGYCDGSKVEKLDIVKADLAFNFAIDQYDWVEVMEGDLGAIIEYTPENNLARVAWETGEIGWCNAFYLQFVKKV